MSNNHKGLFGWDGSSEKVINVGHGNFVRLERIVAILESGSLPMKRLREKACEENRLIDATAGRKMRSLVILDSRHVVLSALNAQTLQERLKGEPPAMSPAQRELEEGEFVS